MFQNNHIESEDDEVEIFYSEDEQVLGAAENDNKNDEDPVDSAEEEQTSPKPMPRRSGRLWAPTQRALESHGKQWDF